MSVDEVAGPDVREELIAICQQTPQLRSVKVPFEHVSNHDFGRTTRVGSTNGAAVEQIRREVIHVHSRTTATWKDSEGSEGCEGRANIEVPTCFALNIQILQRMWLCDCDSLSVMINTYHQKLLEFPMFYFFPFLCDFS